MPRIFLPAVTAKNNALLAGDTQQATSTDFEIQHSDDDSSTEDESTSPDLLRPVCHKRAQSQQQQQHQKQQQPEVPGRSAAAAALVSTGNKRARVQDGRRTDGTRRATCINGQSTSAGTDKQRQAEAPEEDGTFAVVFMTIALGITLAAPPSSDADRSLVVCDKVTATTAAISANANSKICIGDRLVRISGEEVTGLSVDRVQRMIVRGSRPLEMTFRRRRSTADGGATPATKHHRPLGGLERPSRDCLLDTISNIATQEDRLLPDSQPQWPGHNQETQQSGVITGVSDRSRSEKGGPSPPRNDTVRPTPSLSPLSPPLLSSAPPGRAISAGGEDDNGHPEHRGLLHRPGESPASAQACPSPALSSSSLATEADLLSPSAAGREARAAILAAAITSDTPSPPSSPSSRRENARAEAAGAAEVPANASWGVSFAEPPPSGQAPGRTPGGSGSVAGTAKEPDPKRLKSNKKKKRKKNDGSASTTAASAAVSPRQLVGNGRALNTGPANNNDNGNNRGGLAGSTSSSGGGITGRGSTGSEKQAPAQASSSTAGASALAPTAAEVARILAKLGERGVSELTLYKNLSFDELVKVCRYTGGIDLSKRLPKATMAERLNALCVEQGALARELRAAAGAEARTERGEGLAGRAGSAQKAGHLNGRALSTPARPSVAPTPPPRRVALPPSLSTEPHSVQFAASPPPPRRPSHEHGGAQAAPLYPRSSSLDQTLLTTPMTTPQQQQQQQVPLSPRNWNPSGTGRSIRTAALPTSTSPAGAREENGRGSVAPAEDDQHCWEDWDFLDTARGRGGSGAMGRKKKIGEGSGTAEGLGGGGNGGNGGGDDEEAAWWSQEPDHRDWSPCSSPTAAVATRPSRSFAPSRFPQSWVSSSSAPPSAGERSRDGERAEEEEEPRRLNPLLPPTLSFLSPSAGQQQEQQQRRGRIAQSLWSGRFSGEGLGFTALPKWILRSVRTIGTQESALVATVVSANYPYRT